MAQIIAILICIGSIVWAFFEPILAWIPIALASTVLLFVLLGTMVKKWDYIEDLSPEANEMLTRFGTYYLLPFAGRDFSSACSTVQLSGIVIGIIGAFNGFWWGLAISLFVYMVMGPAAMKFNPTAFIQTQPMLVLAHEEVLDWVLKRNEKDA